MNITGKQISAARALLKWTQKDLSEKTDLSTIAIKKIEAGDSQPRESTIQAIKDAFERNGVEFIDRGVREKSDLAKVLIGETGMERFYNDLAGYGETSNDPILVYSFQQEELINSIYETQAFQNYRSRMNSARNSKLNVICGAGDQFSNSDYIEARYLPQDERYAPILYFIYGDKIGIFAKRTDIEILVINSYSFADLFRHQFERLWDSSAFIEDTDNGEGNQ